MSWGLGLAILYTLGWLPLFVFRAEPMLESLEQYQPGERAWVVTSSLAVSLHVTLSCLLISRAPSITAPRAALSALVFFLGVGFWLWARRLIAPLRVRRLPDEVPFRLQRHGPFGVVRNPLYLGVLIAAGAPLIAAPRALLALTFAPCCIALAVRALQDEARMRQQLGAVYETYCSEVKRLVPFLW